MEKMVQAPLTLQLPFFFTYVFQIVEFGPQGFRHQHSQLLKERCGFSRIRQCVFLVGSGLQEWFHLRFEECRHHPTGTLVRDSTRRDSLSTPAGDRRQFFCLFRLYHFLLKYRANVCNNQPGFLYQFAREPGRSVRKSFPSVFVGS